MDQVDATRERLPAGAAEDQCLATGQSALTPPPAPRVVPPSPAARARDSGRPQSGRSEGWVGRLDSLGILLSGICIVHCLALPLLLALLPFLGGSLLGGHRFHEILLLAVLPVSLVALSFGFRRHRDARVLWLGGAGLALLAFATYGHPLFGLSEEWERIISIVGGLIHAAGHVQNFRRTRALHEEHCDVPGHVH